MRPHIPHDAESGGVRGSLNATALALFWSHLFIFYTNHRTALIHARELSVSSMRSDVVEVLLLRNSRALVTRLIKYEFKKEQVSRLATSTTGNPATAFFLLRFLVELNAGRELDVGHFSENFVCHI